MSGCGVRTRLMSTATGIFLLTYVGYAAIYSTRKPFSVVKSVFGQDLDLTTTKLGRLDTAFLASYALGQLALPSRTDALGGDKVCLVTAFAGSAVSSFIFGHASTFPVFFTCLVVNGLLHSIVYPLMVRTVATSIPQSSRGTVLGLWCTSQQIGSLFATAFATAVLKWSTWRSAFMIGSYLVGSVAVMLFFTLPGTQRSNSPVTSPRSMSTEDGKKERTAVPCSVLQTATLKSVLITPGILAVAAAFFCVKAVRYSLLFWAPYYLSSSLHTDPATAGSVSMMFDLGGILGSVIAGYVSDRFCSGRRLFVAMLMAFLMAGSLPAFYWLSSNDIASAWPLLVLGLCVAGPDSILGAAGAHDIVDRHHLGLKGLGIATGIINGTGSIGAVIQGTLTAYIADSYGWESLFQCLSFLALLSGIFLIGPVLEERRHSFYCQLEKEDPNPIGTRAITKSSGAVSLRSWLCFRAGGLSDETEKTIHHQMPVNRFVNRSAIGFVVTRTLLVVNSLLGRRGCASQERISTIPPKDNHGSEMIQRALGE